VCLGGLGSAGIDGGASEVAGALACNGTLWNALWGSGDNSGDGVSSCSESLLLLPDLAVFLFLCTVVQPSSSAMDGAVDGVVEDAGNEDGVGGFMLEGVMAIDKLVARNGGKVAGGSGKQCMGKKKQRVLK